MLKITLFNNLYCKVTKKSSDTQTNNTKTHNYKTIKMRYKLGIKKSVERMMDGGYSGKNRPLCCSGRE